MPVFCWRNVSMWAAAALIWPPPHVVKKGKCAGEAVQVLAAHGSGGPHVLWQVAWRLF
jgi:hypothetical protein